jgi:uncharacterized membrane protein
MSRDLLLFIAVFLACAVEAVEALTIVLAAGLTRGWRSAWAGVIAALLVLAALIAALGSALGTLPTDTLRLVIGSLLLFFGLQWLRKAILRASGFKALHDEDAIFAREVAELGGQVSAGQSGIDPLGFSISFKGVLLEGLEVVLIVVTFGSSRHNFGLAALAAFAALAVVVVAGAAVHGPLSRVPENTIKFAVGVLLTSFGIFWGGEGTGVNWPAGDAAVPVIVAVVTAVALAFVGILRRRHAGPVVPPP